MDPKLELARLILKEALEEGEDLTFSELLEVLGERFKRALRGAERYLAELSSLGDLPPRVAIWRLMNDERWRTAFEEASKQIVEEMLSA